MPGFEFKAIIASRGYHVFKDIVRKLLLKLNMGTRPI